MKRLKMDKTTIKWWIDHSKELEAENERLRKELNESLMTIVAQEVEITRLERNQKY